MNRQQVGAVARVGWLATFVAMIAACDARQQAPVATSGATAPTVHFIGPQPGPDRGIVEAGNPYEHDRTVLQEGRRLFNWFNCSGCHGDHGGGGMGPSLRDSLWYYGGTPAGIFASITEGRDMGMPAWGTKIPSDQIWKIVSYIRSMRTPDEPDAP
jgi:cytochrome c oxidase cbb3-type subunit 3